MPKQPERSGKTNFETPKKWTVAQRIGGVAAATSIVAGIGAGLAYGEKAVPNLLEVVAPDMEINLFDQPETPVLNEFALFDDELTALDGGEPLQPDLPIS